MKESIKVFCQLCFGGILACTGSVLHGRPRASFELTGEKDDNRGPEVSSSFQWQIVSQISVAVTTIACRLFMKGTGKVTIIEDENYQNFIRRVDSRPNGVGLITVANHRSMFDDPGMISTILPFNLSANGKKMRWGICSEEYCFNSKVPVIFKAYFGSGKILPIQRGGGINQKLLLDYTRKVASGDWCHIFPEGAIYQNSELGGRNGNEALTKGKLKWGVAKMIATAEKRPVVIPFYHLGMENMMPMDKATRKTTTPVPIPGRHDIKILFGEEICFDDLIDDHERIHGSIKKIAPAQKSNENANDYHSSWTSSPAEMILYHKMVLRIEEVMQKLNETLQR